ncbi:MAG: hypothetical protein ACR2FM_03355 [Candidatus Saccharimonadales bacterium]
MPPLGDRRIEKRPLSEKVLLQKAEIQTKTQEIYGVMQALAPFPNKRLFRRQQNLKSAVAIYSLPDEPEFRKMTAWVERDLDESEVVYLKTQVIEEVGGRMIRKESERERAYTYGGQLSSWREQFDLKHEQEVTFLDTIGDTLELIALASKQD